MVEKIFQDAPFIALIHNISKNQIKYLKSRIEEYDLGREIRYVMMVYDNPGCSQDDLVNIYGESKANVAKALRKLEDEYPKLLCENFGRRNNLVNKRHQ